MVIDGTYTLNLNSGRISNNLKPIADAQIAASDVIRPLAAGVGQ